MSDLQITDTMQCPECGSKYIAVEQKVEGVWTVFTLWHGRRRTECDVANLQMVVPPPSDVDPCCCDNEACLWTGTVMTAKQAAKDAALEREREMLGGGID